MSVSLDGFFDRMSAESDPGEIARLAADLPPPPDLSAARAGARADAIAHLSSRESAPESPPATESIAGTDDNAEPQSDLVGVMDPDLVDSGVPGANLSR